MTHGSKHDYGVKGISQSCWHKGVSVMTRSSVGCNHADNDINKSKNEMEIERERESGLSLLEGNAWNIATYELVPDLQGDPFVIGYYVPQGVEQWRGWDRRKRWGVPDVCNVVHQTGHGELEKFFVLTLPIDQILAHLVGRYLALHSLHHGLLPKSQRLPPRTYICRPRGHLL